LLTTVLSPARKSKKTKVVDPDEEEEEGDTAESGQDGPIVIDDSDDQDGGRLSDDIDDFIEKDGKEFNPLELPSEGKDRRLSRQADADHANQLRSRIPHGIISEPPAPLQGYCSIFCPPRSGRR
jgi:hypothetical protein